ncbi:MAG: NUDIX hydrolase [Leptolyngbya sp. SIO4C5]|nr:NUDIX hydrolase [Leptolyngbya sp. SIO4C5]
MSLIWRPVRVLLGLILRRPILGTSVIPVLPTGEIVLIRRSDSGLWGLPGGIVDWGEDVLTAARRELAEETGLELLRAGRLVGIYSKPQRDPRFHSVCVALEAHVAGQPTAADPAEVLEVAVFNPQQILLQELSHDHAEQLRDYLAGKTVLA